MTIQEIQNQFPDLKNIIKLKVGGQKFVYKADYQNNEVVLKIVRITDTAENILEDIGLKRILREVKIINTINSIYLPKGNSKIKPNTLINGNSVYCYYLEDYIHGRNVREIISDNDIEDKNKFIFELLEHICKGANELWRKGYVHRDIKPENIMYNEHSNNFVLIDSGIAYATCETSLTPTGMTVGTLPYMSPEQLRAIGCKDIRTDIYSLGIVAYEIADGQHPYFIKNMDQTELFKKILTYVPPKLDSKIVSVNDEILVIINKMIKKRAHQRHKDIDSLLAELQTIKV